MLLVDPVSEVQQAIERQAVSCAHIGSPLYASLLHGLAHDHRAGGLTRQLLQGVSDRPHHDALPLRYLATAHHLALAGMAPVLARHYPSCEGTWGGNEISADFLAVVAEHMDEFRAGVCRNVQTNEVGRAAILAAGFAHIVRNGVGALRTLEVGASAGLLSQWPFFAYDASGAQNSQDEAQLTFGPAWFDPSMPTLPADFDVRERAASDVHPIDIGTTEGQRAAQSFIWPDQDDRLRRLRAAMDVARLHPLTVQRADAGEWLTDRLRAPLPDGIATVVFHAIVWQYLPQATRDAMRSALMAAGNDTTEAAPLHWLRMEPATSEYADLRLTSWPSGRETLLAHVGYHGGSTLWLA